MPIFAKRSNLNITTTIYYYYYYYYIVIMRLYGTVMEIWRLKDMYTDTNTHTHTERPIS